MKRILLAALIGGLIAFAWSAFVHMALPIGMGGMQPLPREESVLAPMKDAITESGLYFFPGIDMRGKPSAEERTAWEAKMRAGPHGMILYHPQGAEPMMVSQLVWEFVTDVIAALIACLVLIQIGSGRLRRALTVMLFGVFSWFAISASQRIFYEFPGAFALLDLIDQVGSWFLAGLAMAGMVRSSNRERRFS